MQYPRAARRWAVWCVPAVLSAAVLVSTPTASFAAANPLAAAATTPAASVEQSGLSSPHLATRMNAELRADLKDGLRDVRPHVAQAIEVLALLMALRFMVRFARRRYARRWAGVHLQLHVVASPAADFTLHPTRRPRKRVTPSVVRLEIAPGRTTNAAYAEVEG
jgi:hypothetical protein